MFQNVLMTALTPLSQTDEINSWENRPFTSVWPETKRQKTKQTDVTRTIKKKPKRVRTAFTTEQIRILDKTFSRSRYIDAESRRALARRLNIEDKCIKIWFQNRRMKEKRDSESSCDSSTENFSNTPPLLGDSTSQALETTVNVENNLNYHTTLNTDNYTPEYELPTFKYDCYTPQYQNTANIMPTNMHFGYDTTVYPTQYYPCEAGYYNTNVENQYAQYTVEGNWPAHNFDSGFY